MTNRIFKAVCAAALSVFVVTMLLIMGVLYNYFSSVQQKQLLAQTALAVQGVEQQGMAYFDGLDVENLRITWIAGNGDVLYDSVSDSDTMENHLQREEIRQALSDGVGQSARYSSTLMKQYLYCAQRLSDGTVLRLSVSHNTIFVLLLGMLQPILIVIAVALVLSFLLASRLSKRIVEPMNRLNLDEPLENEGYDELSPLLRRIYSQQQSLKNQQATLAQKQNELDAIVSHLEEGMLLLDRDCRVITANQAALRLMDVRNRNVAGLSLLSLNRNMELQEAVNQALAGVNVTKKTTIHGRTIQVHAAAVGKEQELSGVAVVLFDITQAEQAEQRRREFTANVSHELKTPLQSISGYSELIQCGLAKPEDVQPFAKRIYDETQRLIRLVEDIINLSRLDEGGGYEPRQMDLYDTAREVVRDLQTVAADKQVQLTLEGTAAEITGVPELARGIVYNLCDNAIKYNQPGGSVSVTVSGENEGVLLTVKDTGIGIPEEEQDRIFERFYRVDKSRSKEVGGTGLGLSIVKHAALVMGAQIQLESRLGQGTTIQVSFPK
ncbi:MAG: ATP-binding protein [Firmicutes bacterium]|nr:ATP-binding protein [Bacillota bacterium]MDY6159488.1 ATP-binding protein [Candidatus Faecousia sp.]